MSSEVKIKKKGGFRKKSPKEKRAVKKSSSATFEKAWKFWQTAQVDLSNFKFDREEANAR